MSSPQASTIGPQFDENDLFLSQMERQFEQSRLSNADTTPQPIPQATPQYLMRSSIKGLHAAHCSMPLLVILDLNGSLLFRNTNRTIDLRDDVKLFLRYLFQEHWVMVWSSATPPSVERMLAELLSPEQKQRLVAVWDRSHLDLTKEQYYSKTQVYKQLSHVWESNMVQKTHPFAQWDMTNTVLVDDTRDKAISEPFNLLEVPSFGGSSDPDTCRTSVLRQVAGYLEHLRHFLNVAWCIKTLPFQINSGFFFDWPEYFDRDESAWG